TNQYIHLFLSLFYKIIILTYNSPPSDTPHQRLAALSQTPQCCSISWRYSRDSLPVNGIPLNCGCRECSLVQIVFSQLQLLPVLQRRPPCSDATASAPSHRGCFAPWRAQSGRYA